MTKDNTEEARSGLFRSAAGKVKEAVGSVTGNSDLTAEGQLQQAEARARRDANTEEAIADAKSREAADALRETTSDAAADRRVAFQRAGAQEKDAEAASATAKAQADAEAARIAAAGHQQAEVKADAQADAGAREATRIAAEAQATEAAAQVQHDQLAAEAAEAEQQAAQLRRHADSE